MVKSNNLFIKAAIKIAKVSTTLTIIAYLMLVACALVNLLLIYCGCRYTTITTLFNLTTISLAMTMWIISVVSVAVTLNYLKNTHRKNDK